MDLGAMAIKGYFAFPKVTELLKPHQMIVSFEALGTNAYNRYAMCPAG